MVPLRFRGCTAVATVITQIWGQPLSRRTKNARTRWGILNAFSSRRCRTRPITNLKSAIICTSSPLTGSYPIRRGTARIGVHTSHVTLTPRRPPSPSPAARQYRKTNDRGGARVSTTSMSDQFDCIRSGRRSSNHFGQWQDMVPRIGARWQQGASTKIGHPTSPRNGAAHQTTTRLAGQFHPPIS